ncbi:MAG: M23 family metallopeptidase [Candidatus Lambdaproteobacteria bacterium]|nr:M23 family metallopeptidase [Candidatus Lambdaproteobacteria bacterium]
MRFLREGFTVIVIPQRTSRVLRLRIGSGLFLAGASLVLAFAAVGAFSFLRTLQLQTDVRSLEALSSDYNQRQLALQKVSQRVETFKERIARMRELDYKLRVIGDLELERPASSGYGVGGSAESRQSLVAATADPAKADLLTLLDKDLKRLEEMASHQEESFNNLKAFLSEHKDRLERAPDSLPTRGFVSSTFGDRVDPFTGLKRLHEGLDIVAVKGSQVRAPADGIVTYTGQDQNLGNMLVIDHGFGIVTRYAHNDELLVREGQRVKRGDPIAYVGSSGKSTGPHLHFEIRIDDIAVNPQAGLTEESAVPGQ